MADAPEPKGPAGDRGAARLRTRRDSILAGGLLGILSVTAATLGWAAAAALVALIVSWLF